MMKKENRTIAIIVSGCVLLSFLFSPHFALFFDDKEIFKYAGLVIFKGGVPYRDVFDHKPPLIYFLNALGWAGSSWLPWMINTLLVLLATLMLYDLGRKKKLPLPWFLPLLFNLLIRNSLVSMGGSMTREYTAIFLLLFFCIMLGRLRYKYILLGILGGLTGWMQQDAMITLLPLLLYALLAGDEQPAQPRSKKFLLLTAGFMLVSLPVLFFFLFHGALSYLWKDAFLFNLLLPQQQMNLIREIKIIKHALHECEYEMTFYTAAILGLISPFIAHKKGKLLYAAGIRTGKGIGPGQMPFLRICSIIRRNLFWTVLMQKATFEVYPSIPNGRDFSKSTTSLF